MAKDWIKKAVNPAHKGFCSPVTKATCTPRRKAFALTMKKHHGFHKKENGGCVECSQKEEKQKKSIKLPKRKMGCKM